MNILIQGIGMAGMVLLLAAFQQNDKKKILLLQGGASVFFSLHFLLLSARTGAALNALEAVRNLAFLKGEKTKNQKKHILLFTLLFTLAGTLTFQGWISLLPVTAMNVSNVALALSSTRRLRLCFVPVFCCWLIYNILSASLAGILTELMNLIWLFAAIWRFDLKK